MIYVMFSNLLIACLSAAYFWVSYRRYYTFMKASRPAEWKRLMDRDPMIRDMGEWIRWPVGSVSFISSIFRTDSLSDDAEVMGYRRRAAFSLLVLVATIVLTILMAALLPRF